MELSNPPFHGSLSVSNVKCLMDVLKVLIWLKWSRISVNSKYKPSIRKQAGSMDPETYAESYQAYIMFLFDDVPLLKPVNYFKKKKKQFSLSSIISVTK